MWSFSTISISTALTYEVVQCVAKFCYSVCVCVCVCVCAHDTDIECSVNLSENTEVKNVFESRTRTKQNRYVNL